MRALGFGHAEPKYETHAFHDKQYHYLFFIIKATPLLFVLNNNFPAEDQIKLHGFHT